MTSSREWRRYFEQNANSLLEIPWHLGAELTAEETAAIARSLKEFQAGESSEGKHLFRYAEQYAERSGDHEYLAAIRLFIKEEQRHGRDLGRFLTINGIAPVGTTLTDRVFRKLRNLFGGLETSIAVLITAEIIAKVYYLVIRQATDSVILRTLCDQILRDELRHVQYQSQQLARLRQDRGMLGNAATVLFQRALCFGATMIVALTHRRAIRRGGLSFHDWWRSCWAEFDEAFAVGSPQPAARPAEALISDQTHARKQHLAVASRSAVAERH